MTDTANNFLTNEKEYWAYLNRQSAVRDYNSAINGARNEGRAEGLVEGRAEGLVEGRAEGLVKGRAEGLVEGRAKGQNQILRLVAELSKAGRFDEISKLNSNPALVENLYKEFNIE